MTAGAIDTGGDVERDGETEQGERETTSVGRSQNAIYVLPHDTAAMGQFLSPVLERVDRAVDAVQALVATTDAETALALASAASRAGAAGGARVLAISGVARAQRLLRARVPHIVVGAPRSCSSSSVPRRSSSTP